MPGKRPSLPRAESMALPSSSVKLRSAANERPTYTTRSTSATLLTAVLRRKDRHGFHHPSFTAGARWSIAAPQRTESRVPSSRQSHGSLIRTLSAALDCWTPASTARGAAGDLLAAEPSYGTSERPRPSGPGVSPSRDECVSARLRNMDELSSSVVVRWLVRWLVAGDAGDLRRLR